MNPLLPSTIYSILSIITYRMGPHLGCKVVMRGFQNGYGLR